MTKQLFNPLLESNFQKMGEMPYSVIVYRKGTNTIAENLNGKIISIDTDLSIVLNAAIATLTNGGVIFIRTGTYQLGGEIPILYDGISVLGEGIDATKLYTNNATANVFTATTRTGVHISNFSVYSNIVKTAGAFFRFEGCAHIYFDHLRIFEQFNPFYFLNEGMTWVDKIYIRNCTPFSAVPLILSYAIYVSGGSALRFSNIIADAPAASQPLVGLYLVGAVDGFMVYNCDFLHHVTGFRLQPDGAGTYLQWGFISDSSFDSAGGNGIYINPTNGATVRGFVFVDTWTGSCTNHGILTGTSGIIDNITFIGHRSINNMQHGVVLANSASITNITFESCQICSNSQQAVGTYHGIVINQQPTYIKLYNNKIGAVAGIVNNQGYGVIFNGNPQNYIHVIQNDLTGNTIAGFAAVAFTNSLIMHNIGYNPQPLAAIAVGASPYTYINNSGAIEQIHTAFVSTTAFVLTRAGVGTNIPFVAAHTMIIDLYPGDALTWTYNAGAPTALRIPM